MQLYAKHGSDRFDTGPASFEAERATLIVFGGDKSEVPGTPTEWEWNHQRAIARGAAEGWSWALLVPRGVPLAQVDGVAKEWMGRVAGG